ncbi:hypothetical protein TWF718_003324 [Orbilia javanica]|uniref:Uncharacterized protein n=1 Tax=Orbilia javanica TaxID=47235 RepID=A0AAN8MEH4_9PEZI
MAAVAGRRERVHQRSNSTPVGSSTTTTALTATRNNSHRNFSTSSTTAPPTAASLTTQHHRPLSKTSTPSTSSATNDAAAVSQPQSARRRLTSTKRHSSGLSQSQSVADSPLVPNNSVSGRQDSSTTVSAVNPPVVPNKRHSAPSADLGTARSRPTNPLHQRSVSSSSPAPSRHSRKPSDGPSVTTGRGPDSATITSRTSRSSTLGSSRTSRTTAAASSPARTPATTSATRRTTTSSPARTPAARPSAAGKPQPPVSKPTHRRADSASVPSSHSSRASTSPIPPQPAPPVPSSATPPSAPPPPEASSAGIPPQIQAELDKNASIQITQPPRRAKAPARFSSNGIATADAPPPSLAYRQLPLTAAPPPPPAIPPPPPAPQPPPPRPSVEDEVEDFQYPPPLEEDNNNNNNNNNNKALVTIEVDDKYLSPPTQQETMTTYETEQFSRSNGVVLTNGYSGKYNATVEDDEPTITTLRDIQRVAQEDRSFASSPNPLTSSRTAPSQNGDDPFLNLARSSTPRSQALLDAQARQERRRSRMMQYSVNSGRTSNLAHEYSSTPSSRPTKSTTSTTVSDDSYGGVELSHEPQYQAPEQSLETDHSLTHRSSFLRRQRETQNGHARSVSEAPPRTTLTRANGTSGELPSGAPRPSQSVLRSPISTLIESDRAKNAAQARLAINDDAQSTISSGTVWDELDELKMRIKRLELTGTLPPASSLSGVGSGISSSSGDRPRTGTTAATTVSSSPRHQPQQPTNNNNEPVAASPTATGPPPTIHPVLHAALAKTKTVLPDHIIKALDALANDTLNLAQAVGSTGQSTMSINTTLNSPEKQLVTDRQIRRKVDNVCRSLTELCVSLADGRMPFDPEPDNQVQTMPVVPPPQIQQPQIQQQPQQPQQLQQLQQQQQPPPQLQTSVFPPRVEDPIERTNTAFDYRSPSVIGHKIDREATVTPNSAARAHARFEARRASLLGAPSPQYISRQEASPSPQPGANRLSHRNSMSLRGAGDRRSMIEPEDEIEIQQPTYRSPSRASNLNTSTAHLSPLRTTFTGQSYESSPMQRTLTLREQRAMQQAQQLAQVQQAQTNLEIASSSYLSASGLQHRRTYSTASTITPTSSASLGLTTQRRSYLDRERGITDNGIGTALTTGSGVGSASQPIDISRRRTEYLRAANGGDQQQIQTEMRYSPPESSGKREQPGGEHKGANYEHAREQLRSVWSRKS